MQNCVQRSFTSTACPSTLTGFFFCVIIASCFIFSTQATLSLHQPVEKCYFLSVAKVSYGRETTMLGAMTNFNTSRMAHRDDTPTHKLVVLLLKGAWTPTNRDIIFALYDSFRKTQVRSKFFSISVIFLSIFENFFLVLQQLKKNLSTAALKGFRCSESSPTPIKVRSRSIENQVAPTSPLQVNLKFS